MSQEHNFGGTWTEKKLTSLSKYLTAYTQIFSANEKAKYFRTYYIDAFAGTGYRNESDKFMADFFEDGTELESKSYLKGSAIKALELTNPFHSYRFIEKNPEYCAELEKIKLLFPNRDIEIIENDANSGIQKLIKETDWKKSRGVIFLDPYGMQVDFSTLKLIGETKALDMWLLFPVGMGVLRMLTKEGKPSPEWTNRLNKIFGTTDWETLFYEEQITEDLFGDTKTTFTRAADWKRVSDFMISRLETCFHEVLKNPILLTNSRNNPMYLLFFAVGNEKGHAGINIAKYLAENA